MNKLFIAALAVAISGCTIVPFNTASKACEMLNIASSEADLTPAWYSDAGDLAALIKKFRAVLTAEIHASIDPSSDIARQEGAIDTADHLLAEFNKIFPEA